MRELYEQYIAYARAYGDALPIITAPDNHLAGVCHCAEFARDACSAIT